MGSFSDYAENKTLDHWFGASSLTKPGTVYLAALTATPTDASTGSTIVEPSGNNYSRVAITNNDTNFSAASSGSKTNAAAFTFPQASGSWGTITHYAIVDAASAGNVIVWGALSASKAIESGDTLQIPASNFTLTLD